MISGICWGPWNVPPVGKGGATAADVNWGIKIRVKTEHMNFEGECWGPAGAPPIKDSGKAWLTKGTWSPAYTLPPSQVPVVFLYSPELKKKEKSRKPKEIPGMA